VEVNFGLKLQKLPSETLDMLKQFTVNPQAKEARMSKSKIETMLIGFIDIRHFM
jgi:hypothetical protein